MTVCAGKLTPQAKVAVDIKILIWFYQNKFSINFLSFLERPAWWIPNPFSIILIIYLS